MGLAPYGNGEDPETEKFEQCIREHMVDIRPDGSVWLNQKFFNYATGLTMTADGEWEKLFGVARREPEAPVTQSYCNMALAIQHVTEEVVLKMAKHAQDLTGARYLCLAGGVALNCVANSKIIDAGIFEDVWVQPAAGDARGALGAALAAWHMYFGEPRAKKSPDAMRGAYLGPEYSDMEAIKQLRPFRASFKAHTDFAELSKHVATLIADGNVVGWFQGRMEWGPRALGNRSILGDPRSSDMQKKMHLKIKYRESFRPFAPAVMEEHAAEYFHFSKRSPYMLFVAPVESKLRVPKPEGYEQWSLEQRLYFQRSSVPAITHLGYSARLQTVGKETNERFWALLDSFYQKTGCPLVINTSFNVRGEPIVCTPADAYRCFMNTEMDYLVIGNLLFEKGQQPAWEKDTSYASQLD
jgi:carbamoyltransferase